MPCESLNVSDTASMAGQDGALLGERTGIVRATIPLV